jgi:predicted DNA-binding transcriptional regulator YafY
MTIAVYATWYNRECGGKKMDIENKDKTRRVLGIYQKLISGSIINKSEEARIYGVNERSIQRDIEDIRAFLDGEVEQSGIENTVIYDRTKKGYRLEQVDRLKLSNGEIFAICKILLDSRAFTKKEMSNILGELIDCCVPKANQKLVRDLISNEEYHYIEPRHKSELVDKMWDIGQAIREHKYLEIKYHRRKEGAVVTRKIQPVAIMFSEYYFYLTAFIDDEATKANFDVINDSFPTIYRIDRIQAYTVLDEKFRIPYGSRFEEGEFRKRIQFMYGGKLRKVKFTYSGDSIEAILDRLPTAKIISEDNGKYTLTAEVFGKGIDMWFRSQGELVEVIE